VSEEQKRVEFRGRMVADHYPERHAHAQSVTAYDDFGDGVRRDRIRYGDPKDRYPGGITYATREERIAYRMEERKRALTRLTEDVQKGRVKDYAAEMDRIDAIFPHHDNPDDYIEPDEEIRTDHRCADCGVDVGEFHLPGCDIEVCPKCGGQAISCGCTQSDDEEEEEDEA
jgi:hypothetical protein